MAAKTVDPAKMAQKWKDGMARSAQAYKDGIAAVTVNPMALAATPEAMQNYLNGVQRSVSSGKRAAALNRTDQTFWRNQAMNYGAQNFAASGAKGFAKYQAASQRIATMLNAASQAVQGLPKGGLANAQARQNAALAALMNAAGTA